MILARQKFRSTRQRAFAFACAAMMLAVAIVSPFEFACPTIAQAAPTDKPAATENAATEDAATEDAATEDAAPNANPAIEPSRFTLEGEKLSLADAIASIEKQTGNKLIDYRAAFGQVDSPILFNAAIKNETYWQGLDRLLDQAGLTTYAYSGEPNTSLVMRPVDELPRSTRAVYSGAFRIEPFRVLVARDFVSPAATRLDVRLEVAWEPKLRLLSLMQPFDSLELVGADGKPIEPKSREGFVQPTLDGGEVAAEMNLSFVLPPRSVEKIASFHGKLQAVVAHGDETFHFDHLTKAKDARLAKRGATVTLHSFEKEGDLWDLRVYVAYDPSSGALSGDRGWLLENLFQLKDAKGAAIESLGFETIRQTKSEIGLSIKYFVDGSPDELTFDCRVPVDIVQQPVEYEFKNIPLP